MFENHRKLIEAVQQDAVLPELQEAGRGGDSEIASLILDLTSDLRMLGDWNEGGELTSRGVVVGRKMAAMMKKMKKLEGMMP